MFRSRTSKKRRKNTHSATLRCESLEDRRMMAVFTVNNLVDGSVNNPNELPGSFRQAIFDANETPGQDTIVFEGFASSGTLTLSEGALQVTESIDIVGPGASELTISGGDVSNIFHFGDETGASTFHVSGLTLADGFNGPGNGGAILFSDSGGAGGEDTLNISDAVIRDNSARFGGGIHAVLGTLNITDTTLTNNEARNNTNLQGGGALSLEQSDTTLERVTLTGNTAANTGGGINSFAVSGSTLAGDANLTIIDSDISGNTAARAGGIASITRSATAGTSLAISGSTISDNLASGSTGGGIRADGAVVMISNSTLSGNRAGGNSDGGAILTQNSDLLIENSTLSSNISNSDSGAIHALANASVVTGSNPGQSTTEIVNSTIAFNSDAAGSVTAQAQANSASTIRIANSIFSDNANRNFNTFGSGQALIVSDGFNISDDNSGGLSGAGDQQSIDPLLLPLADNGGLTQTHALRLESPAIDAGSNALAVDANGNPLATDQRGVGFARILDGTVDVGAFETELLQGDLIVSTTTDVVDNEFSSGELSLREAVLIANSRDGVDTITFDSALNGQIIELTDDALTGELQVTESVDIVGPGASDLTISGGGTTGIFWFGDETGTSIFNVSGLTLANGNGETDAGLPNRFGGAVLFFDQFGGDDTLNISDSSIEDSTAVRGGGLHAVLGTLNISDTTIALNSSTRTTGETGGGGLSLEQVDTTLQRVDAFENTSNLPGGGIANYVDSNTTGDANLTIIDSNIINNTADGGGGIANITTSLLAEANLNISGSTISDNRGTSRAGGGIRSTAGVVTVSGSLISDNVAAAGGGIFSRNADLRVENTTLSGNNSGNNNGGAIRLQANRNNDPDGLGLNQTEIVNSTIAFNTSNGTGAVVNQAFGNSTSVVTMQNSIFSNNNGSSNFGVVNSGGTISLNSAGHNISDDITGNLVAAGDQINTDPMLFLLANNGGLTQTHALQVGSPAIDAGSNALAVDADGNALTTDQRGEGFARILDGTPPTVDIGAFENKTFDGDLIVSENSDVVDSFTGSGQLSLREAVLIANDRPGFDSITFAPELSGATIVIDSQLPLTESVDIIGPGASQLTISADNSRIFEIGDVNAAATFSLSGLTLADGFSASGNGGAILFSDAGGAGGEDTLNISDAVIRDSSARFGGGIHAVLGTLNITDTTLTNNEARNNTNFQGGGALSLEQSDTTLERVTMTGNTAASTGGGINSFAVSGSTLAGDANLTIIDSDISGNTAARGGGIASITRSATADTSLTISGSTISFNVGLSTSGGGIRADGAVVTISNSELSGNIVGGNRDGGAILTFNSDLLVENSTFSGNASNSDSGAIHALADASVVTGSNPGQSTTEIVNSTIAFNSDAAGSVTAEGRANSASSIRIANSIFSDNADRNFNTLGAGQASIVSDGFNISDDNTGNLTATGDQPNTDPLLEPLADNGGPTHTHALQTGSPAIDAGNSTLFFDQRGLARPFDFANVPNVTGGNGSDIGAFELRPAETPSLVVNTDLDVVDRFDGVTSIREAVEFADSLAGADTITFDPSLSGATIEFDLVTGGPALLIDDALTIDASALSSPLTLDANGQSRVLVFGSTSGDSTIDNVTITGGITTGQSDGAGILFSSNGTLTLNNSTVSGNSSIDNGGGIYTGGGTVRVIDSAINGNTALDDGGGIHNGSGDVTVINSTITGNSALDNGGGIRNSSGDVTVNNSTINGNSASDDGGGIRNSSGDVTVTNSTIRGNSSSDDGGGIRNDSGAVIVIGSTISGNTASDDGGGIRNRDGAVIVSNSTISGNTSTTSNGGGIRTSSGDVTVTYSTVDGNSASSDGGGIRSNSGTVTVTNSTVSRNTSQDAGGGIRNSGGDVSVINSTVSGNSTGGQGGGVRTYSGNISLVNSTLVGNTTEGSGGGVLVNDTYSNASIRIENSIVAGNVAIDGGSNLSVPNDVVRDPEGQLTIDNSLIGNAEGLGAITGNGNLTGTQASPLDPQLGVLADNGGPTQTHALLPGSPAIDAGDDALALDAIGIPLTLDQRGTGFDRIVGGTVDIGAFEFQGDTGLACDFNGDGVCDGADIDLLQAELVAGTADPFIFDLTGDGIVSIADRDEWLALAGAENLPSGAAYLIGDANLDGIVDGLDFIAWNTSKFTADSAWTRGDFNADGVVDGSDFIAWNGNKFQSSDSVTASTGTPARPFDDEDQSPLASLHQLVDSVFAEGLI